MLSKPFKIVSSLCPLIAMGSLCASLALAESNGHVNLPLVHQEGGVATAKLIENSNQALDKILEIQKIKTTLKVIDETDIPIIRSGEMTPEIEKKVKSSLLNHLEKLNRSEAGGVDSGGGSIVTTKQGQKGLVDFFANAPEYFGRTDGRSGVRIPQQKSFWRKGPRSYRVDFKTLDADHSILEIIESWQKSSPKMVAYLKNAYDHIPVLVFNGSLKVTDRSYFIPANLKSQIVSYKTVAFYDRNLGLIISRTDFEQLSYLDQVGLLMKELLRHVQINYHLNFSAEELQVLNVKVLKGSNGERSLDLFLSSRDKEVLSVIYKSLSEMSALRIVKDTSDYSHRNSLNWAIPSVVSVSSVTNLLNQVQTDIDVTFDRQKARELMDIYDQLNIALQGLISLNLTKANDPAIFDAVQGLRLLSLELQSYPRSK